MKKTFTTLVFMICLFHIAFGAEPKNFKHEKLHNGLEVFTLENTSTPLVYIEIAVRAGGIAQTEETAGLFHLYEHMMFKGNKKYPNAAAVQSELAKMGVGTWNGSTAAEYVNYYFTIPSSLLKEGLEFWSYAIRYPLLQEQELANEKKVVLAEIEGGYGEPQKILGNAVYTYLFKDYPWRLDPGGTVEAIKNSTISQLKEIQKKYYIPKNAALFIGGDINHKETLKLVKEIYGDWENPKNEQPITIPPQNSTPFSEPAFFVQGNSTVSPEMAEILVYYRGPDTRIDTASTYPADIWGSLIQNPQGKFKKNFLSNAFLAIPSPEYVGGGYYTSGDAGRISFFGILLNPNNTIIERSQLFYDELTSNFKQMQEANYFSAEELKLVKMRLQDDAIIAMETTEGFLSQLRYWWSVTSTNYYLQYEKNMQKTSTGEIISFVEKYLIDKNPMIILVVNDAFLEKHKTQFLEKKFTIITDENAYWWKSK